MYFSYGFILLAGLVFGTAVANAAERSVDRFGVFEAEFNASGRYDNPYRDLDADAEVKRPDGSTWRIPLFWDGSDIWKLRVSPDISGKWSFLVSSKDRGLNGRTGSFECRSSNRRGSIQPMAGHPRHFQYQNGELLWFMGDTAWALYTDSAEEKHNRETMKHYVDVRAEQGFNVLHSMLLSEAGWGNQGGLPFHDIGAETINSAYWREVDLRLDYLNRKGMVAGLTLAWGDKRKVEPFAWRRFPHVEARKRYARYIAARYSAYDVYFLVSGEWQGEVRTRDDVDEMEIKREFIEIGDALHAADPHGRMIGIHPMTRHGSVREFNEATWMSFGDYQQNYRDLHARMLESRRFNKAVVNAEYGYYLRDRDGDGTPDKDNSTSLEAIRHATWDIVMSGGYVVTGFGTTYFGGHRDPGPFDVDTTKNDDWEAHINAIKRFFQALEYWKLESHDQLIQCITPRGREGKQFERTIPPATTYWCLAEPGKQYVVYLRGLSSSIQLDLGDSEGEFEIRRFNPRTGKLSDRDVFRANKSIQLKPDDGRDWVFRLRRSPAETVWSSHIMSGFSHVIQSAPQQMRAVINPK
ncbi:MAG: DUF4038 domain-containing protein [Nitrospiraceae bacterium]